METKEKNDNISRTGGIGSTDPLEPPESGDRFGIRLKELRKELNLNQKDFCGPMNISPSYLSELEAGKVKPGFELFYALSKEYDINIDYLIRGEEPRFLEPDLLPGKRVTPPSSVKELLESGNITLDTLYWFLEHSSVVRFGMMGEFTRYLMSNREELKKEQERKKQGSI